MSFLRPLPPALVALLVLCPIASARGQGRPAGVGRIWAEFGLAAAQQSGRSGYTGIGGASITGTVGTTIARGLGAALLVRGFQQFGFETTTNSRYVIGVAQYSPRIAQQVSLNAGGGWGRHTVDDFPSAAESGAVMYAGGALRLPARSTVALTLFGDVMQSVSGASASRPRLVSVGIGIGFATTPVGVR